MPFLRRSGAAFLAIATLFAAAPVLAEDENEPPYWASIRPHELNMRVGPSEYYQIAWVYRRAGLPLKVIRKKEGWRLVRDPEGAQGWVVARFLSRDRTAYVTGKAPAELREGGSEQAKVRWKVEPGVSGRLGECKDGWCRLDIGSYRGWMRQERLWGAGEP